MFIKKILSLLIFSTITIAQLSSITLQESLINLNSSLTHLSKIIPKKIVSKIPTAQLKDFDFHGASVMTFMKTPKGKFILLSREAGGWHKGTYDAFGGARDSGENHPVVTAAREFAEESMYKLFYNDFSARKYIDIDSGNTTNIIAIRRVKFVVYLTEINSKKFINFAQNFYKNRNSLKAKGAPWKLIEKDKIAWIEWNNFADTVRNAKRDSNNKLIRPILIKANVVQPNGSEKSETIELRPVFVDSLQSFFKGIKPFRVGKNPKIRFYHR